LFLWFPALADDFRDFEVVSRDQVLRKVRCAMQRGYCTS
jgi:hypothetical protein